MNSDIFQNLFDLGTERGADGAGTRARDFWLLRGPGDRLMLLPLQRNLARVALATRREEGLWLRGLDLLLRLGLPVPLRRLELAVPERSPLVDFLMEAPRLHNSELGSFAVTWVGRGRFEFLLFNTLDRPSVVARVGWGAETAYQLVAEGEALGAEIDVELAAPRQLSDKLPLAAYAYHCRPGLRVSQSIADQALTHAPRLRRLRLLRRIAGKLIRRFLFFWDFFALKRAQIAGHGKRWVRPGVAPSPLPDRVDIVYLWRDESDPEWIARREADLQSFRSGWGYNRLDMGSHATRTSLDRLKFSLRSVEKYFASLGKIYIVTDRQRPGWLVDDPSRIQLVDHREIFGDHSYLPSYNSQAIESHMHRIPGLSEFFVYLNDDFFFNHRVTPLDFFTEDGKILMRLGRGLTARGVAIVDEPGDTSAQKNANLILDRRFRAEMRPTVMHRPYAHRRSLLARAEEEFPEAFHLTRRSHFRSVEMVAIHNVLVPFWAYYLGEAQILPTQLFLKDMFYWSNDPDHNAHVLQRIQQFEQISFCIQAELSTNLTEESVAGYHRALGTIFPDKSSFEI